MPSIDNRLAALERDNRALRAEIAELKNMQGRKVLPVKQVEQAVTVTSPVTFRADSLPNAAELRFARKICAREYPAWCDSAGFVFGARLGPDKEACEHEWYAQFERDIFAVSNMRVLDKPDTKRLITAHIDACSGFLRSVGEPIELRIGPLLMAAFCMGVPVSGPGMTGKAYRLA